MLTARQARKAGYEITEGSYVDGSDNCAGRYYYERIDATAVCRFGRGHATKRAALDALELHLLVLAEREAE